MSLLKKLFTSINASTSTTPNNTMQVTDRGSMFKATSAELSKILADSDKAIDAMHKADEQYDQDGDINKRIAVYEKYLKVKPQWNSFNFDMALAKMYVKAGRNNDAWGYLNQMYIWSIDPTAVGGDVSKIRFEQFKILKSEKKYADAMVMLVSSYLINAYEVKGIYFNKEKFIKDSKTTSKRLGHEEDSLRAFANDFERKLKAREIQEKDVQQYVAGYFR